MPCEICPGLLAIASRSDCERIVISGRRTYAGPWEWTVDVITQDKDGHAHQDNLEAALNQAAEQLT